MKNKKIIEIPYDDWLEETQREGLSIKSKDDIIQALRQGISTSKVTVATIVSREEGIAPEDIISPNKSLLYMGARGDVINIVHKEKHDVVLKDGSTYEIHDLNGRIGREMEAEQTVEDDTGPSFVDRNNELYLKRACDYLEFVVPGYIAPRLVQIFECKGDVKEAIGKLRNFLDEMEKQF